MELNIRVNENSQSHDLALLGEFLIKLSGANAEEFSQRTEQVKSEVTIPGNAIKPSTTVDKTPDASGTSEEAESPNPGRYTEDELKKMPSDELISILGKEGVNPADYPGQNTNKKLRSLILESYSGNLGKAETATEAPNEEEETSQTDGCVTATNEDFETGAEEAVVTIDMCRDLARSKIEMKKRDEVVKAFRECGVPGFPGLAVNQELMNKFYDFLK